MGRCNHDLVVAAAAVVATLLPTITFARECSVPSLFLGSMPCIQDFRDHPNIRTVGLQPLARLHKGHTATQGGSNPPEAAKRHTGQHRGPEKGPGSEYPDSIAEEDRGDFIRCVGEKGWYLHAIAMVNEHEQLVTIADGLGHRFNLSFSMIDAHLQKDHGWSWTPRKGQERDYYAFLRERAWYAHTIVDVNDEKKLITIRDGLGKNFQISFDFFFFHTSEHHKWTNNDVAECF